MKSSYVEEETVIIKRIARLIRATRKQLGLSQEIIAKKLGLIQSAMSRIETGTQMLSAPQWAEFCHFTGISPDCIMSGYVDLKRPAVLKQDDREGTFRIPKKYAKNRGSKVRAVLPFLNFFESVNGSESLRKYLKSQKLDPDFFICLDNQINIDFSLDLVENLVKSGDLQIPDLSKLSASVVQPGNHGVLHYQYEGQTNADDLLGLLIPNAPYYECNFKYVIEDRNSKEFIFSVSPEPHMEATKYRSHQALGDFLCTYKKHYFSQFTAFGGRPASPIKEVECQFHGAERCIYRTQLHNS